jgi:hypothetical protein
MYYITCVTVPVENTSLSMIAFKSAKTLLRDSKAINKTSATPAASATGQTSHNESATSISDSTRSYIKIKQSIMCYIYILFFHESIVKFDIYLTSTSFS